MDLLTAVNPTSSSSSDPYQPSFFELAAQEQLRDLIKPAARYVLAVLAQRLPRHLLRIVNRFDEVYALVMLLVERHYLRVWGSSFAENFYGLRRRRRPALATSRAQASSSSTSVALAAAEVLRPREIRLSLLFLVGLPYAQAKLQDYWEQSGGGVDDALFEEDRPRLVDAAPSPKERARAWFKKVYPYAGTAWQLWLLSYNVGYLFDKTPYWRPWFQAMRVDVRRMGGGDGPRRPLLPEHFPPLTRPLSLLATLLKLSPTLLFEGLKYALPASIFFFKFLEWWYGADNPRRRRGADAAGTGEANVSLPLFGPPKPLLPSPKGVQAEKDREGYTDPGVLTTPAEDAPPAYEEAGKLIHNSCPLCGATPIANPAILPSGYVFCYTCAHAYVEKHARCPVTLLRIPDGTESLRKVLG